MASYGRQKRMHRSQADEHMCEDSGRLGIQPSTLWPRVVKSVIDRLVACLVFGFTSPALLIVAFISLVTDGSPVLFQQTRVGRRQAPFRIWKFRTMRLHDLTVEAVGQVTGSHPLVTPWGRVLRRTKLDELPQLLSVITGHMSLVGPRPTIPEQVSLYDEWELRRLEVLPGLTGWAQVNGNASLSWSERIDLDVWYIDHWSIRLDLKILAMTLRTVLLGEARDSRALKEATVYAKCSRGSR